MTPPVNAGPIQRGSGDGRCTTRSQKVQKILQRNYKKPIAKKYQKSYNMVTARARTLLSVKSFSSCFRDIGHRFSSSGCSPSQSVIHVLHRRCPASCAKELVWFPDELFCILKNGKNQRIRPESMTLCRFGGHFACFSIKDIYKVWRSGGLYSGGLCGTVYTINL